jgi:mono/diheme cytochrome c family protein
MGAVLVCGALAGCQIAPSPPKIEGAGSRAAMTNPVRQGQILAESNCGSCHAVGHEGASPNPLSPPFRDVVLRYPPENLAEALAEGISVGHPKMPPFVFQPADDAALIAYLKSLKSPARGKP